jgi:hypothetical protein
MGLLLNVLISEATKYSKTIEIRGKEENILMCIPKDKVQDIDNNMLAYYSNNTKFPVISYHNERNVFIINIDDRTERRKCGVALSTLLKILPTSLIKYIVFYGDDGSPIKASCADAIEKCCKIIMDYYDAISENFNKDEYIKNILDEFNKTRNESFDDIVINKVSMDEDSIFHIQTFHFNNADIYNGEFPTIYDLLDVFLPFIKNSGPRGIWQVINNIIYNEMKCATKYIAYILDYCEVTYDIYHDFNNNNELIYSASGKGTERVVTNKDHFMLLVSGAKVKRMSCWPENRPNIEYMNYKFYI